MLACPMLSSSATNETGMGWRGAGHSVNMPTQLTTVRFSVGKQTTHSFCAVPVRVEVYSIECDEEEVGALPGCTPVKKRARPSRTSTTPAIHFTFTGTDNTPTRRMPG